MKKIFRIFTLFAFLSVLPLSAFAKMNVVTTIPDLADLVKQVGQDHVVVQSLARGDQDPHFLEPKPSYIVKVNQADLLVEVGLELEIGWLPVLLTQSRNPKVLRHAAGHLDASEGILVLERPTGVVDRSMGDVHPDGNPHYWLNPNNGILIAQHIAEKLSELDPAHANDYQNNFKQFSAKMNAKIVQWNKILLPFKGKNIITQHKSFTYFAAWSGLNVAGFIEPKPGIPPSPSHILSLVDLAKQQVIRAIVTESYYDTKAAKELGQKTNVPVLILPTSVGGADGVVHYEDLFDDLVKQLAKVL